MKIRCNNCNIEFQREPSDVLKYTNHYCSNKCKFEHMKHIEQNGRFELKHKNQIIGNTAFCVYCKEYKDFSEFYCNKALRHRNCLSYECKVCSKKNKKIDYIRTAELKRNRRRNPNIFLNDIIQHAKNRKRAELGFDLDIEYCIELLNNQNHKCAISGVDMTTITGEGQINTNISIDRIDSSVGYIKGNIQFVCRIINIMKTNLSSSDFLEWCNIIVNNNKNDICTESN